MFSYTGITEHMLNDVTTNLYDVQKQLLNLFNDETIIIGHSLEYNFAALQVFCAVYVFKQSSL